MSSGYRPVDIVLWIRTRGSDLVSFEPSSFTHAFFAVFFDIRHG